MITDTFESASDSVTSPAQSCFAIQPSDSAFLQEVTKAIYVGKGGNVVFRTKRDSTDVTFMNVPAGIVLPVRAVAVRSTGTTAGDFVGLA